MRSQDNSIGSDRVHTQFFFPQSDAITSTFTMQELPSLKGNVVYFARKSRASPILYIHRARPSFHVPSITKRACGCTHDCDRGPPCRGHDWPLSRARFRIRANSHGNEPRNVDLAVVWIPYYTSTPGDIFYGCTSTINMVLIHRFLRFCHDTTWAMHVNTLSMHIQVLDTT